MKRILLALVVALGPSSAYAGDCKVTVARTPCPGKEAESFKKCNGAKSCDEVKKSASAEACAKEAQKECEIFRPKITKSKVVTATFDGKSVQDGKDLCGGTRPDFNKCD